MAGLSVSNRGFPDRHHAPVCSVHPVVLFFLCISCVSFLGGNRIYRSRPSHCPCSRRGPRTLTRWAGQNATQTGQRLWDTSHLSPVRLCICASGFAPQVAFSCLNSSWSARSLRAQIRTRPGGGEREAGVPWLMVASVPVGRGGLLGSACQKQGCGKRRSPMSCITL